MQKEYTQTKEQVLEGLRTDRQGLSAQEAEKRLREHGENRLKEAEKLTLLQRFVQQLKDPMLLILLAAAAVSAVTNILSHESFYGGHHHPAGGAAERRSGRGAGEQSGGRH